MLDSRQHIAFVFSLLLVLVGVVHGEPQYTATPAVSATAVPYGGTVVTDEAQTPESPLLVEATSANGGNTAWAQAAPGRLSASSVIVNAPEAFINSQGVSLFVDNFRLDNPAMSTNTTGVFFFRFVLTGTMRILASDLQSSAMVNFYGATILGGTQTGQVNFGRIDGVPTLYAVSGGMNNPVDNIMAGPGGDRKVYGTTTGQVDGYHEITMALPVTFVFQDFPVNTSPPTDDWKNQIEFRMSAVSFSNAASDFSSTFEFAPQNPIVPDSEDAGMPVTGWTMSAASAEIPLPAVLTVATSTGSGQAAFVAEQGTISNLSARTQADFPEGLTEGNFVDGWFEMDVALLDGATMCDVEVVLPAAIGLGATWWFHDGDLWQSIALDDDDSDPHVLLQIEDNGFGDADPAVGLISIAGGISDEEPLPAFLSFFDAVWCSDAVELSWKAPTADAARLRVEAYLGDQTWSVPLVEGAGGNFTARDEAEVLFGGGSVRYDLCFDGDVLDSRTIELPGLIASRLDVIAPNPFNPKVEIAYIIAPGAEGVELAIHDLRGRHVVTLAKGDPGPGHHVVHWEGQDANGQALPSGVYLVRLATRNGVESRKISLVR